MSSHDIKHDIKPGARVWVSPGVIDGRRGLTRTRGDVTDLGGERGVYVLPCVDEDDGSRIPGGFYPLSHVQEVPTVLGAMVEGAESWIVTGYEPGNGSRFDLLYGRRAGGGWCVVWVDASLLAVVRRDGRTEPRGKRWAKSDLDAVEELSRQLVAAGLLS